MALKPLEVQAISVRCHISVEGNVFIQHMGQRARLGIALDLPLTQGPKGHETSQLLMAKAPKKWLF